MEDRSTNAEDADDTSIIALSVKDSEVFIRAISNPREPSEKMQERVAGYLAQMGEHPA